MHYSAHTMLKGNYFFNPIVIQWYLNNGITQHNVKLYTQDIVSECVLFVAFVYSPGCFPKANKLSFTGAFALFFNHLKTNPTWTWQTFADMNDNAGPL